MTQKSANQLYKESGTTLSFKDWIAREKSKGVEIPNIEANKAMMNMLGDEELEEENTTKKESKPTKNTLIKNIAITSVILVLGYFVVRTFTKKNNE